MEPLGLDDVLGRERYAGMRDTIRRRIIEHKRTRRVAVGDRLTFLFEDLATVWYQAQEMLWVEQITDLDAIRAELAVCSELLPRKDELSTTLFVEVEDQGHVREELTRLIGIDEHVTLEIGDAIRIPGAFEPGRQTAEKLSAVQYVRFPLDAAARRTIGNGTPLALSVAHPNYRARVALSAALQASLAADVSGPESGTAALRRVRDA